MIIVGYPGIGKTTAAGIDKSIVDLESSFFKRKMDPDAIWSLPYANVALDISRQGFTVCVSSHSKVIDSLVSIMKPCDKIVLIYPSSDLRSEWIKRLDDRISANDIEWIYQKNCRALDHVRENFVKDVAYLDNSFLPRCELKTMDYDIKEIIDIVQTYDFKLWDKIVVNDDDEED